MSHYPDKIREIIKSGDVLYAKAVTAANEIQKMKCNDADKTKVMTALWLLSRSNKERMETKDLFIIECKRMAAATDNFEFIGAHKVRLRAITRAVCKRTGVSLTILKSPCRSRHVVFVRQEIMYLACTLTNLSLPAIGEFLNRDHTTVMHGKRRYEQRMRGSEL